MTFLEQPIQYITTRVTNYGRKMISKGDFNIKYFQIGDSEYDYKINDSNQKITVPFDINSGVKYPYRLDNNYNLSFGVPLCKSKSVKVVDSIMSAGFVDEYTPYVDCNDGSSIFTYFEEFNLTLLNGTTSIPVIDGDQFNVGEQISIIFYNLCDRSNIINDNTTNSLIYKVVSKLGNVLVLDRELPLLRLEGNGTIICNRYVSATPEITNSQKDSWTSNIVWSNNVIGTHIINNSLTPILNGNRYSSTKNYLGYTKTEGQTFTDLLGDKIVGFTNKNISTGFIDSFGQFHEVKPEEQRDICIIHNKLLDQNESSDAKVFMYDDFIDTDNELEFKIYIPFLMYHRSETGTIGAYFIMDDTDYYVNSNYNETSRIKFRFLKDENDNRVGKIFVDKQLIIFDDQEIVAALDYRSNRKFTLPAPKIGLVSSNDNNSLFDGNTKQTFFVTYMVEDSTNKMTPLPCNYFIKIESNTDSDGCNMNSKNDISLKFNGNEFKHLSDDINNIKNKFYFEKLHVLIQETDGSLPKSDLWKIIDVTNDFGSNIGGFNQNIIGSTNIVISNERFEDAPIFDLGDYMGQSYLSVNMDGVKPMFGEEQDFAGSIKLNRGTNIEEMSFYINLPETQFNITQNPTYTNGDKFITEVVLLDDKKKTLVEGKLPIPIKRVGTQVLNIKIDF